MSVIVYGDFNCVLSYLASQRVDALARDGCAGIDWRAVEHDPHLPLSGTPPAGGREGAGDELAGAAALARPGEQLPGQSPSLISNTGAAVAAYAEAVSDGLEGELRRRLFDAIWAQGRHLSHAPDVQAVVAGLMWEAGPAVSHMSTPDIPHLLGHDPDMMRIMRRSGGTIALDGGPVSTAGHERMRRWRREWLALPGRTVPAVISEDGGCRAGADALQSLARLFTAAGTPGPG